MNDLISRQAAIDAIEHANGTVYWNQTLMESLVSVVESVPTIDPVKHGEWVKDGEAYALYKCSACNDLCTVAGWANCIPEEQMRRVFRFCPNCGARMERSEE